MDKDKGLRIAKPELAFIAAISGVNYNLTSDLFLDKEHCLKMIRNSLALHNRYVKNNKKLHNLMYFDLKSYLVDDVLSLLDKMTMAVSIEGRVPLLDHRLVELAFKIPDRIKYKDGQLKGLFKAMMKGILPQELFSLPKVGFAGPTYQWVNILREQIYDDLINNTLPFYRKLLNINTIKKILDRKEIKPTNAQTIFNLYIFSLWYRKYFNL